MQEKTVVCPQLLFLIMRSSSFLFIVSAYIPTYEIPDVFGFVRINMIQPFKNIGILITDHNVDETLQITDRAYLLFEGKILFKGTPEELAANAIVKEKYLGRDFELKRRKREE